MGIRVNKALGYGILDLRTRSKDPKDEDSGVPDDPRWDYAKYLADWCTPGGDGDAGKERDLKHFLNWCIENKDRLLELNAAEGWRDTSAHWLLTKALKDRLKKKLGRTWTAPYSAVSWGNEFQLANVVLFQPPQATDWTRHDDIIDYYEESNENGSVRRATLLPRSTGIFPHDGYLRRFREPTDEVKAKLSENSGKLQCFAFPRDREKDGADITEFAGGEYNQLVGRWDSNRLPPIIKDELVLKHLIEDWRPRVPFGIIAAMEYLGCFPNSEHPDSMINSLRPMVYVWWG